MGFSFIIMSCGYVENNYTSFLIYSTAFLAGGHQFETRGEAIKELALDLYHKYYDEELSAYENRYTPSFGFKACCTRALFEDRKLTSCPTCKHEFADKKFSYEEFCQWICGLHGSTCDSYGESEGTLKRHFVWAPWWSAGALMKASMNEVIFIAEKAEEVILEALFDAMPELKVEDSRRVLLDWETDWQRFKKNEQPEY